MKIMRKNGSEIRRLEFSDCFFNENKADVLNKMFNLFTRLESLQLSNAGGDMLDPEDVSKFKPANLPHLKKVVMHESNIGVSFKRCLK